MNASRLAINPDASSASLVYAPASVHVFGPLGEGWSMRQPLPVRVERDEEGCIVSDDVFNIYGHAPTWDAAVADYKVALVEYFDIMSEGDDAPSRSVVEHLRTYIEPPKR